MKHKKLILSLSLLIISIVYIIDPFIIGEEPNVDSFKQKIIRFHIKANSDKQEDQALKLKVRDEVLKEMGSKFEKSKSLDETRRIVEDNMDNMKAITERVIKSEGKDFPVRIFLGNKSFPTRKYGNMTFPSGEYETVQITIGEGKGRNWWCVMFPPLCFVDVSHGNTSDIQEDLKEILTEEEIALLQSNKEEPPIIIKSKIVELIGKTKDYFAKRSAEKNK